MSQIIRTGEQQFYAQVVPTSLEEELAVGRQRVRPLSDDAEWVRLFHLRAADPPAVDIDERCTVIETAGEIGLHRYARVTGRTGRKEIGALGRRPRRLAVQRSLLLDLVEDPDPGVGAEPRVERDHRIGCSLENLESQVARFGPRERLEAFGECRPGVDAGGLGVAATREQ